MKDFKKINILNLFNLTFVTIFMIYVMSLNLIPKKYLLIICAALYIYPILCVILTNIKFKFFKILGIILIIVSYISMIVSSYFVGRGDKFLDSIFDNAAEYEFVQYYVVSYAESEANSRNDINDIVYYSNEPNMEDAIKTFNEYVKVDTSPNEDILNLFAQLSNRQINFVLVSNSLYNSIFELNDSLNKDNYKIIYKYNVKRENKKEEPKKRKSNSFNLYIGGTDFANLADFNMIVTVNMDTHNVLLTSIPRDYYIEEYNTGGKKDTLSFMGANGLDVNKKSLEMLFNTNIDYYLKINTKSLVKIVDTIGGINYCSDISFTTSHALVLDTYDDRKGKKLNIKQGCQRLNGIETLTLARERNAFPGRDRVRQKNCQAIMVDIFDQLKSVNTLTNYNEILNSLSELYETTLPRSIIENIIKDTISGNSWKINQQSVDGTDTVDYVHLSTLKGFVMYPDMTTVEEAKIKINNILK